MSQDVILIQLQMLVYVTHQDLLTTHLTTDLGQWNLILQKCIILNIRYVQITLDLHHLVLDFEENLPKILRMLTSIQT